MYNLEKSNRYIKVLVIDDNKDNLVSIKALIQESFPNATVITSTTGNDAIELAEKHDPDVILLDILMPGIDGFLVCEKLKEDEKLKEIPVVFVTAMQSDRDNRVKALEAGGEGFLTKPIDPIELQAQIKAMIKIKEANQQKIQESDKLARLVKEKTSALKKELTEHKKTEAKLRASTEYWKRTFNAIQDAISIVDTDQKIVACNEAFMKFVNKQDEQSVIGQYCFNLVHKLDNPHDDCPYECLKNSAKLELNEMQIEDMFYEVMVDPLFNEDEKVTGAVHIASDITKKKNIELIRKLRYDFIKVALSADNIKELLVIIKLELGKMFDTSWFDIVFYDDKTKSFYREKTESTAKQPNSWVEDENKLAEIILNKGEARLLSEDAIKSLEKKRDIKFEGPIPLCWMGAPLFINNTTSGVMLFKSYSNRNAFNETSKELIEMISYDLGFFIERINSRKELIKAKEKAEENDRLKTAFLANMSHEIRTPMNGILGFTDILKDPNLSEDYRRNVIEVIEKSGQRLFNLINDLIDISMIESGQMAVAISEVDVREECKVLLDFFRIEASKKGLLIELLNGANDQDIVISTDKSKFVSILSNLIKNAIKFTDEGNVTLGYTKNNDSITIFIKDTGIGISAEKQKIIFDRFIQADNSMSKSYEGAGLGLSISKAYTELLGGEISLESELGKGSKFSITLPLLYTSDKKDVIIKDIVNETTQIEEIKKINRILIAEDDDISLQYMEIILLPFAHEVHGVKTGRACIDFIKKHPDTSLILMDVKMPDISGLEATKIIKELNSGIKIIAQSANALQVDYDKAIAAGCDDYIEKPISKDTLFEKIMQLGLFS